MEDEDQEVGESQRKHTQMKVGGLEFEMNTRR
jgi:hypothetical protein